MLQMAHEQLQSYEGEHAQAEDSEDHHIGKLLHRLEQSANDGFQSCQIRCHLISSQLKKCFQH